MMQVRPRGVPARLLQALVVIFVSTTIASAEHGTKGRATGGQCAAGDGSGRGARTSGDPAWRPMGSKVQEPIRLTSEAVDSEFIVRFSEYKHASEHKAALVEGLGAYEGQWEWVDRVNRASKLPTDFGVLRFDEGLLEGVEGVLATVPAYKDIHRNMKLTRSLMWEDDGEKSMPVHGDREEPQARSVWGAREASAAAGGWRRSLQGRGGLSKRARAAGQGQGTLDASAAPNLLGGGGSAGPHPKGPGRIQTKSSFQVHAEEMAAGGRTRLGLGGLLGGGNLTAAARRQLLFTNPRNGVTSLFSAQRLWDEGFSGKGVKMAVFDTGIRQDHPHMRNIKDRSNWTHENTLNDGLGHGTFVAGVIASQDKQCPGFAPDVDIHTFRVFTNDQVSYTSWFLDAFNYAIATEMNILNLSIGGPDYLDRPFVEKIWEITSNNIIMVSAIGNDGPLYGTLNNPADQMDVIGVGGIDYNEQMASFSSRGMSTWELPRGYGRAKPDIVAFGRDVMGSRIQGGCRSLSGTSVASPVAAGAVCLLASVVPEKYRWKILNPASMKQALVESAVVIRGPHLYEQGQGRFDLGRAKEILQHYRPRASALPADLDFTRCPYMWPHCTQPIYSTMMPFVFNVTVINGMGLTGHVTNPVFKPSNDGGRHLDVTFTYSDVLWPWTGYLGLYIRVRDSGRDFSGHAAGTVEFTVTSPPYPGESSPRTSLVSVPLKHSIVPTPKREKRILWDQYHSIRYPPGYIPRDNLDVRNDILDWHGDHPHTNFHGLYDNLRQAGYYLEVLGSPLTCFDARNYGTLLMADSEEEYYPEEVTKLHNDVLLHGLGLVVFAEWYHVDTMVKMRFFDDNTRSWWTPATGGGNVPALNDLLAPFGIALSDRIATGSVSFGRERATYASGSTLMRFPAGGWVHSFALNDRTGQGQRGRPTGGEQPVLGLVQVGDGRVAVFGDANCLDSSHIGQNCYWMLRSILEFSSKRLQDPVLFPESKRLRAAMGNEADRMPLRRTDVDFREVSTTLTQPMQCTIDSPLEFHGRPAAGARVGGEVAGGGVPAQPQLQAQVLRDPVAEARGQRSRPVVGAAKVGVFNPRAGAGREGAVPDAASPAPAAVPSPAIEKEGAVTGGEGAGGAGGGGDVPSAGEVEKQVTELEKLQQKSSVFPTKGERLDASFPSLDHNMPRVLAATGLLVVFTMWRLTRRRGAGNTPGGRPEPRRRTRAQLLSV